MAVSPIPPGYRSLQFYLVMQDASAAIAFYEKAFGAVETVLLPGPKPGSVGHAEMKVGDSIFMLADDPGCMEHVKALGKGGANASSFVLYCEDCDALFAQAVAAGAKVVEALADKFWGDRSGSVLDPFGFVWHLMTHKEEVSPEEIKRRLEAMKG